MCIHYDMSYILNSLKELRRGLYGLFSKCWAVVVNKSSTAPNIHIGVPKRDLNFANYSKRGVLKGNGILGV